MMKFLVKYGIHAKAISVEETELTKVKDIIKESFNIEDDIIIQRFDKTWEEFIDINCKIKIKIAQKCH
jgi:hypothetical protein